MYQEGSEEYKHQLAAHGPLTQFGYKDFIPRFTAEHFDPEKWAELFKESGAKYVVPVFEHHDGFAMYDSGLSDWTAVKMGPHRDVYGELAKSLRARGLRLGASSHRVEHDFFLDGGRKLDSDVNDAKYAAFYGPAHSWLEGKNTLLEDWTYLSDAYLDDWLARDAEIVEKYNPDIIYFDWWIGQPNARRHLARFASFYYNRAASLGKIPVLNYKLNAMQEHSAVLDIERGQLLADGHVDQQQILGLHRKGQFQIRGHYHSSAHRHRQQKWEPAGQHRSTLRRHHPRAGANDPARDRFLAQDQR